MKELYDKRGLLPTEYLKLITDADREILLGMIKYNSKHPELKIL